MNEQRTVIFQHPKGIFQTVEIRGIGVLGSPYCVRETEYTPQRDYRHVAYNKRRLVLQAEKDEILRLFQAGLPALDIARKLQRHSSTVYSCLRSFGIQSRENHKMSPREMAKAQELYQQGWSYAAIGRELDRWPETISDYLHRIGMAKELERRPPLSEGERQQVQDLYGQGVSCYAISKRLGRSTTTITRYLQQIGW